MTVTMNHGGYMGTEGRQDLDSLTMRQRREVEYHAHHALRHVEQKRPQSVDVIHSSQRRWWNAYWEMYHHLRRLDLRGKKVLVFGCGFGHDAIRLALMGADVEPRKRFIVENAFAVQNLDI